MRLKKIILRNFRGISESVVEFADGVTIVAGPNEIGKTSIAEAISLVRTMKDSSRAQGVRAIQPIGKDVGPEVELEFTARGHDVWVHKRWLKQPITELRITGPVSEALSGDEAHERLGTFLAEHMDVDLFDALEVVQGASLQEANLVGLRSLGGALADDSANPADHDELLERIEAEYSLHFTSTGRARGEYQDLRKLVEELEVKLADAKEQGREMDTFTADVERERIQHARDEADLEEAEKNLTEATARDAALAKFRDAVDAAQREADGLAAAVKVAEGARETRERLVKELAERTQAKEKTASALAEATKQTAGYDERTAELKTAREAARENVRDARAAATAAAKAVDLAIARADHDELQERIAAVERAQQDRLDAAAIIAGAKVDDQLLKDITEASTRLSIARATRDAAVARVNVTPLSEHRTEINGESITEATEILVNGPIEIEVPGYLKVDITPGALPEDHEREVTEATAVLDDLLARGEVESVEQARDVNATHRGAMTAHERAGDARDTALGEQTLEELQELFAAAAAALEGNDVEASEPGDLAALRAASTAASERITEAEDALTRAETAAEEHAAEIASSQERVIRLQAEAASHTAEAQRALTALEAARAERSDEELDSAVTEARTRAEASATRLEEAKAELAAANPEAIEIELTNAKDWAANAAKRAQDTQLRLERAIALVDDRTSRGIYDLIAEADAELKAAQDRFAHVERRAAAAKLLRDVITRHRDAAHAKYVAPFAQKITSFGKIVFGPDFGVEITPDLRIASRTLNAETIPFDYLSAGAREQLGLLGRLAAAALVDDEDGAPLILDDALGFADDGRLASLGAVLNEVGKDAQIIVLTCQPQRFSRVGSAEIVHLPTN